MDIEVIRKEYYPQTTIGELHINGEFFCYTLEDTVRPYNIKVPEFTAIPEDTYFLKTRYSPSFERDMLLLYNDSTETKVTNGSIMFTWIYFHGGNEHLNTKGCILVAHNKIDNKIQGSAEVDLFNQVLGAITNQEEILVRVINTGQRY